MSPEEAIAAIRFDFTLYPPQTELFLELCPIILGESANVTQDFRQDRLWMALPGSGKRRMQAIAPTKLGEMLCRRLEDNRPAPAVLAEICARTFKAPAYIKKNGRPPPDEAIWVETGMDHFQCRQCGQCCRQLDYHDQLTEADYQLWHRLGRTDILEWVGVYRRNGKVRSYSMWLEPGTRRYAPVCPWLKPTADGSRWICQIHEVKPEICRQYPYTRKHGLMTGCAGFD